MTWSLACALALTGLLPAFAAEPTRIVAIGDSITAGGRAGVKEYTYRLPLLRMLRDEDACFEFVGAQHTGLDAAAEWPAGETSEHEGYYGAKTAEVLDKLAGNLWSFAPPDIALVHLGTNDSKGYVEDDIIQPLQKMVALLRSRNPKVTVLIAEISQPRGLRTLYLHLRVAQMAASLSTPESRVISVDQYSDWHPEQDTFDGVHPNLKGQRKMAERWLQAMKPFLRFGDSECAGGTAPVEKQATCAGAQCELRQGAADDGH